MSRTDFSHWLHRQLVSREWTQADFARRYQAAAKLRSTPTGRVSEWLSGDVIPGIRSVEFIADTLNVSQDTVMVAAGHRPPDIELAPDDPRRDFIAVINKIRWDDPARVRQVKRYLEGLYDDDKLEAAKMKAQQKSP